MALTPILNDNSGATTYGAPATYASLGGTPQPVVGPGGQGDVGGVALPTFSPGPSLPGVPGASVSHAGVASVPTFTQNPPPAAPSSAAAPATQPGGGFNLGLINTFPGVADSLALEQQGIGQLDANLNSARQRAIIQFGDPALASMAGFGLDPQAGAFAQQNYLSGNATLSRLDKAHQQAAQSIINQLASHGLLNSGDLGYKEGQENQGYGNSVYDAQQGVLGQLADLFNNYLSSRYGLESNANSSKLSALQAFLANPDAYATLFNGANGGSATSPATGATAPGASGAGSVLTGIVNPKAKTAGASAMRRALSGGGRTALA